MCWQTLFKTLHNVNSGIDCVVEDNCLRNEVEVRDVIRNESIQRIERLAVDGGYDEVDVIAV